jgi:hypothetical protein
MMVLLETVIVVEKRENVHINFHSRLIISARIVWLVGWLVRKVWGRHERKVGEKRNMCPHLLRKLQGHCLFRVATNMYYCNYNAFCNADRPITLITAFSILQNVTDVYAGYLIARKVARKKVPILKYKCALHNRRPVLLQHLSSITPNTARIYKCGQ